MISLSGLLPLVRLLKTQILIDNLGHVLFGDLHVPESFRPDHHVRAEGAEVQATAAHDTYFPFEIALLAYFSQFLNDSFRTVVAARLALAVAVVDANLQLTNIRLSSFDHKYLRGC